MKMLLNRIKTPLLLTIIILLLLINISLIIKIRGQKEEILLILPTKYNYFTTKHFVLNEQYDNIKKALEESLTEYIEKEDKIFVEFGINEYQFIFYNNKLQAINLSNNNGLNRIFPRYVRD